MVFEVTDEQVAKAEQWVREIQLRDNRDLFSYGAIGGALTYCFTQTSLGVILVVEEALSGQTLNLTDFSDW